MDASSLLLEKLTAGPGAPPRMSELFAQFGESDPRMALVAKYLDQRESAQIETTDEPEEKRKSLVPLQRLMKRLYRELEELRERNDTLAAALGGCYLCWGENPQCEICAGIGSPGSNAPDEILFSHYVTPAIRRLRTRAKRVPPRSNDAPTSPAPGLSDQTSKTTRNNQRKRNV
jgi:hypothetical protein